MAAAHVYICKRERESEKREGKIEERKKRDSNKGGIPEWHQQ